ncbi:MAG: hypothetical protein Q8M20_14225 [Rhodocyclaceae bacterium]|nr:hypothetical protein [Rhodocyclaceae bacterium]MDZ4216158.1 hypothetical protein [Rhodocyclaceae bacterium]
MLPKLSTTTLALLLGIAFALPAAARITCCDVNGKRTCGDPAPAQCVDKAKKVFDKGGVAREVERPLTQEELAAREAEKVRAAEEKKKAEGMVRRDRALKDSYTTEKDIDKARDRAIAEIEKNAEQAKNRLDAAEKKKLKLDQEKEFYTKKPIPANLQSQIKDNEAEIATQQKALQQKDVDIEAVKARFEADKLRYRDLTGKK